MMKITYKGKVLREIPEWKIIKQTKKNGEVTFFINRARKDPPFEVLDLWQQMGYNDDMLYSTIESCDTLEWAREYIKSVEDKEVVSTEIIPYP